MKKIYTLAFLLLGILSTSQAQIKFTFNGNDVATGDTVRIQAVAEDWGGGFWIVTAESNNNGNNLRIVNTSNAAITTNLVASVVSKTTKEAIGIQCCAGGQCASGSTSVSKQGLSIAAGGQGTAAMYDLDFQTGSNYGIVKTTFVLTAGSKSYTCLVNFEYPDPAAAIQDLNAKIASKETIVYDLTGKRVNSVKHGFYIVNGKKVYLK